METTAVSLLALFLLSCVSGMECAVCRSDSDCGSDECCYIKPAFEVVSKRQASILPVLPTRSDTGVCEKYRIEHEHCGPFETANGHCGCGPGLSCQFVPAELSGPQAASKRSIILPGPGNLQCKQVLK